MTIPTYAYFAGGGLILLYSVSDLIFCFARQRFDTLEGRYPFRLGLIGVAAGISALGMDDAALRYTLLVAAAGLVILAILWWLAARLREELSYRALMRREANPER